jgi:hypothetical protein
LRTAIVLNLHQPHGARRIPVYILNLHQLHGQFATPDLMLNLYQPALTSILEAFHPRIGYMMVRFSCLFTGDRRHSASTCG